MRMLGVLLMLCLTGVRPQDEGGPDHGKRVVGYYAGWSFYGGKFPVKDIRADKLTHINYAFANVKGGKCVMGDKEADPKNFAALRKLKEKHPHLRTLIAVGGWTWSGNFSDAALTEESRRTFARSCVEFMKKHGFDGVDIDWEYPAGGGKPGTKSRLQDTGNFTLLLKELRDQLGDALLTIAAPAGPAKYRNMELSKIHKHLDWINLMTYDFHGSWDPTTGLNAPLHSASDDPDETFKTWNCSSAVEAYRAAGIPAGKIVLGIPFYGHGFQGVPDTKDGLYQKHRGKANGSFTYRSLAARIKKYKRHWHGEAKVPWLYDAERKIMITYDDPESVKLKARFVNAKELAGVMIWELSHDTRDDTSLLRALDKTLR